MSVPPRRPKRGGGLCGLAAGLAFLLIVGLPVLFVASFANAPCEDGPCNPNGPRIMLLAETALLVLAAATALFVWLLVDRSDRRHEAEGAGNRSRRAGMVLLAILLVPALWIVERFLL